MAQRCLANATMIANCEALADELNELHHLEELYWFMRVRTNKLRYGDKSSKYFHLKVSSTKHWNIIKGLYDEHGIWRTSKADLERLICPFYESVFSTSSLSGIEEALKGLGAVVTEEMNVILEKKPTGIEIQLVNFSNAPY